MSGHNKWSKIKRQKKKEDRKRGRIFSQLSEAISTAVKEGGGDDPEFNPQLRMEIERAKEADMPKENIQKAIDRGAGRGEFAKDETFVYEGFGPQEVAVVIKGRTDNRNRTASEMKTFFERNNGSLGAPGSTSYLFEEKGVIKVEKEKNVQEQLLRLIDLGIEDYQEEDSLINIYTQPKEVKKIKKEIEEAGFKIKDALISMLPKSKVTVDNENQGKIEKFLKKLRDREDVEKIFSNAEFANE